MLEKKYSIAPKMFFFLLNMYSSKKSEFERGEICDEIGININNSNTYNSVMSILRDIGVLIDDEFPETIKSVKIRIDRKKLEKTILSMNYYKTIDKFIHTCMFGAITP